MNTHNAHVSRARAARRTLALLLAAWLSLVLPPALAAAPVAPAGMDDCHHDGDCPEMRASACDVSHDLAPGTGRGADGARTGAVLALLPVDEPGLRRSPRNGVRRPPATGPPLVILFGHLRN